MVPICFVDFFNHRGTLRLKKSITPASHSFHYLASKNNLKRESYILIVLILSIHLPSVSQTNYTWSNLKIGGGGYVTGMVIHPKNKNIKYFRTDVGGAYRWDEKGKEWIQLLNWVGPDNANLIGVDGIALDPNVPDRVYLALGKNLYSNGGVYRSENRGQSWQLLFAARYESNGKEARWIGECLAVDPVSSKIIYAGSRQQGLWRSSDDGKNWSKITDVPEGHTGNNATGIRSIVFDNIKNDKKISSRIYVSIPATGIYYSENQGKTFSLLAGSPKYPARLQVVNHELFVTHSTGIALWSEGTWINITPKEGKNYVGISVDVSDSRKIVAAECNNTFNNPIYRSSDKGKTWNQLPVVQANLHTSIPWWPKAWFSSATATLVMAPGTAGELYYTDWFGVWRTPDIWSASPEWFTEVKGHEETVNLTLVAPPSGALVYSGLADVFGFRHETTDEYPLKRLNNLNECYSIAVCEKSPSNIAVLGAKTWYGDKSQLLTSEDFGNTWISHSLPGKAALGRIVVSPTDPGAMVYVDSAGTAYFTKDKGERWSPSVNAPINTLKVKNIWSKLNPLAADLVSETFYLFKSGTLFASTDGGEHWSPRNAVALPDAAGSLGICPAPSIEGELWVNLGKNGLWRTSDGGRNFNKIQEPGNINSFTWGAPADGSKTPTAYCYATFNNQWGLYQSLNMGISWQRINDDDHQFPSGVQAIAGDRNLFGRIYVGTGGLGVIYGQPAKR